MLQVGITGAIGSGKTTICKIFAALQVPVYNADDVAKELNDSHPQIKLQLKKIFGEEIYSDTGLNRQLFSKIIFSDKQKLEAANKIIHPLVSEHYKEWLTEQNSKYVIKEAALLFESGSYKCLGKIITVTAPAGLRYQRVRERSGITLEKFNAIESSQFPEAEKMKRADHLVINDEQQPVLPQVLKLHTHFLNFKQ